MINKKGEFGPWGEKKDKENNTPSKPAPMPSPRSYMPSTAGPPAPSYSGGGGSWDMEKTIFLFISVVGVIFTFLVFGFIFGIVAILCIDAFGTKIFLISFCFVNDILVQK